MIERLPLYIISKVMHTTPPLPINYTFGLTYRCNSYCKTCRIFERTNENELNIKDWQKVFKSIGRSPYWVTFTGGEPFLYQDLIEVYYDLCEICHPSLVNVPTNGLLTERIVDWVWQMCKMEPRILLTINVSIDHLNEKNDEIRGVSGAYEKALETVKMLQKLDLPNLHIGIHTVISRFNVKEFMRVYEHLHKLVEPSLYITEVAENRNELGTMELDITPSSLQYRSVISYLKPSPNLKSFLRSKYYKMTAEWLENKSRILPCYAGYASCQIAPTGEVWFCCVNATGVGNVLTQDFRDIWKGQASQLLRRERDCSCPLANVAYTNMILSPWRLITK